MGISWDSLAHLKSFFLLDFLFSGIQVSSVAIFTARLLILVLLTGGLIWAAVKILLKTLDCLQTFLGGVSRLPWSFFHG